MTTKPEVTMEQRDDVLLVLLDRPDRLNAVTLRTVEELILAFDRADADDDVRAVVVTGRGRAFCAGADLSDGTRIFATSASTENHRDGGGRISLRILASKKPVIAAVNGPAVGVGAAMTLPMDMRIASTDARFGFVYTRRGIGPEGCASWFLPRVVGIDRALDWVISGRVFGADEALEAGLVRAVVPPDALVPTAIRLASEMVRDTSAVAVAVARQMLWRMLSAADPVEAHLVESKLIPLLGTSPDAAEGVGAFLDKRAPQFPGRVSTDLPKGYPWLDS